MATLQISLEDSWLAELEIIAEERGQDLAVLISDTLTQFAETRQMQRAQAALLAMSAEERREHSRAVMAAAFGIWKDRPDRPQSIDYPEIICDARDRS